jgi:hypothetical protein
MKCKDSFDRPCSETATNSDFFSKIAKRLAQHRTETRRQGSLAQANRLADAFHYWVGNFVCPLCPAGKDIVDVRFVA